MVCIDNLNIGIRILVPQEALLDAKWQRAQRECPTTMLRIDSKGHHNIK